MYAILNNTIGKSVLYFFKNRWNEAKTGDMCTFWSQSERLAFSSYRTLQ